MKKIINPCFGDEEPTLLQQLKIHLRPCPSPFRNHSWQIWLACMLMVFPVLVYGQIESVTRLTAQPRQYERIDFVTMLTAHWDTSPYRAREVRLDLTLASPSGARIVVPAYYNSGKSDLPSVWHTRFAPIEAGEYKGNFVLTNEDKTAVSSNVSFTVTRSDRKGFLHVADAWTFRFDNGEAFRGIGENVAWESRSRDDSRYFRSLQENPRYNYEYLLGTLAADGGNFFRTWMCPWNLPLEWKTVGNTGRYQNDDGYFNASAIQRMDRLVDLTESLDIYMMLTLNNSSDFQGGSWPRNNYNVTNGGPVATPQEFFSDPGAKAQYQDRLRYLVARWGYSPHIAAWEFFNEIDNLMYGLPQRIPDEIVTTWHAEMSAFLKSIDPYHHLVTTSISHRDVAGLNQIPSLDFNQRHIYGHNGHSLTQTFSEVLRHDSLQHGKPYVIGECGFEWDWSKNFDDDAANMDADFKKGLWEGLFSPTPVLPMSWWWEYFDHRGMTAYIRQVRGLLDQMLGAGHGAFADAAAEWSGPPIKTLAVRCGETFFVLLANDTTNSVTGGIALPLRSLKGYQVMAYDPERDVTNSLPPLLAGKTSMSGLSVAPTNCFILIVSPR